MRQKFFSSVTILGLAAGFTCFLLIFLYVRNEFSYDKFHDDHEKIYRLIQVIEDPTGTRKTALTAPRVSSWAVENLPQVESMTRLMTLGRMTVGNEVEKRDYEQIWVADTNFFTFFSFPLLKGHPIKAMKDNSGIILNEKTARKYFNTIPPVGESLYNNRYESKISAIVKDIPSTSHFDFDIMLPEAVAASNFKWWNNFVATNWTSNAYITYFKLNPGTDVNQLEERLREEALKHYKEEDNKNFSFYLQPLADIHFHSDGIEGGVNFGGTKAYYSYLFISIGIIILLVACFNYMNLSTTAAVKRTKEVGLRKTVGAYSSQLIFQFLAEAILLAFISLIISILLVDLLLPFLNDFMNRSLTFDLFDWQVWIGLILLTVFTGTISGLYPAFVTARISPAKALKANSNAGRQKFTLRKALVTTQFAVAITMIASTVIIYRQLQFLQEKDLGFNLDNLVVIDINSGNLRSNFESIKLDMKNVSGIEAATVSSRVPGEWKPTPVAMAKVLGNDKIVDNIYIGADHEFISTFDINLISGRNFTNSLSDSLSIIINQEAARSLGLSDPVGAEIIIDRVNWYGSIQDLDQPFRATVIGVVEDFNFESFKTELKPMIIAYWKNPIHNIDYFTVRTSTGNIEGLLTDLRAVNNKYDPENPMEYHFLNAQFERFYQDDVQRGKLFLIFSIIVVVLSCMGLFALASYMTKLRIKEVGIRKVLGAQGGQIVYLLIKDFAILIVVAFVIAVPVGYFTMDSWLDDFVYKTGISWWSFAISGFGVLLLSLVTISTMTIRAASINPVDTLKGE